MERITWIVIWLIVVACLVELVSQISCLMPLILSLIGILQGEVVARLVFHAASTERVRIASSVLPPISKEEALRTLERMMVVQS